MLFGITLEKILVRLFIAVCILPVHEFAHAYTAYRLGDKTAKLSGRMTLNPLAHIDPVGFFLMLFVGVGYAKPVPVNMRYFNRAKRKRNMAIVSLAGPVSNLIMSFVFLFLSNGVLYLSDGFSGITYTVYTMLFYAATINVSLAVFNLIPIPPLDGSRILSVIIPDKYYYKIMEYERYLILVILVLAFMGVLSGPISEISAIIIGLFDKITSLPFTAIG